MYLIKENYHHYPNHGALYHVQEEQDENGHTTLSAVFVGNVVCLDINEYLADNPDIKVVDAIPSGIWMK